MAATLPIRDQRLDGKALAIALGYKSSWVIRAIKKANGRFVADGEEEPVFQGRYSTPAKIVAWLEAHPEFIAAQTLAPRRKSSKPRGSPPHLLA